MSEVDLNPKRHSFSQYRDEALKADPYLMALWNAVKDVHGAEEDAILDVFPDRDEWYAQQQAQKEQDGE